jgi:type 1 glutamine amidotransferase
MRTWEAAFFRSPLNRLTTKEHAMIRTHWLAAFGLVTSLTATSSAADKLKALIIDGRNNHDWKATTPLLKKALESCERFTVDVVTAPPRGKDISGFRPKFDEYNVVLSNYNDGDLWSEGARKDFLTYVKAGGGFVVVHAANNAFTGWKEYNDMIGLGWRDSRFGERLTLDDDGNPQVTPKGEGPGAGHGPQHEFQVVIRDADHPITKGLPRAWMHAKDELYHGQRGPARDMTVLATAYSANEQKGTSAHEPMLWVIPYGKGRVFTTVLGHATYSMECVGFITTLQRGTEWAATGKVTLTDVPEDFPTADKVSVRK